MNLFGKTIKSLIDIIQKTQGTTLNSTTLI